ncbi:MAG TPA: hypothetical protein VFW22_06245 [Pseudolabrys sp.]|nr:hypothetical protein [Pseudolabrys sp.]
MSKSPKDMERAQAAFHKKEMQQREGAVAMADYRAGEAAERAKTAKLRALRLAKEAADAKAEADAPPPVVKTVKPKAKPAVKKKR